MAKLDKQNIDNLIKFYLNGNSLSKTGDKFNISAQSVRYFLLKNNIKTRSFIESNRIYTFNKDFFKQINIEENAYWLGFIYADGNISIKKERNRGCLTINLCKLDNNHLLKFKDIIKYNNKLFNIKGRKSIINNKIINSKSQIRLNINSIELTNDLIKLGCIPRKSLILKFPTFEQVPTNLINHFIRGYFDGDGCITFNKENKYVFSLIGTFDFLNGVKSTLLSNNICNGDVKIRKNGNIYILQYGGNNQLLKLYNFLYRDSHIFLNRKKEIFEKLKFYGID